MPGKVFISYSRADVRWLKRLRQQLCVLAEAGRLEVWDDTRIEAGSNWLPVIEQAMADCDVAVLLVSAAYLTSGFVQRKEIPALLQRRAQEGLCIVPVLIGSCAWHKIGWLEAIAMPLGSQPLDLLRRPDSDAQLAKLAGLIDDYLSRAARRIPAAPKVDLHNLPEGAAEFLGRGPDLDWLDAQWQARADVSVVVLVAPGGTGKTSLLRRWLLRLKTAGWGGAQRVFAYSFYRQGVADACAAATDEPFLNAAEAFFGLHPAPLTSAWERGRALAQAMGAQRALLVLDGLEPLQDAHSLRLRTDGVRALLATLADAGEQGQCVLSTRVKVEDLRHYGADGPVRCRRLDNLGAADGARLLHRLGVDQVGGLTLTAEQAAQDEAFLATSTRFGHHALTLHILGLYLASRHHGDLQQLDQVALLAADAACKPHPNHAFHVMHAYEHWLAGGSEDTRRQLAVLTLLGLFDRPATPDCLRALREPPIPGLTDTLAGLDDCAWNALLADLQAAGLVQLADWQLGKVEGYGEELAQKRMETVARGWGPELGPPQAFPPPAPPLPAGAQSLDAHPLLREYFARRLREHATEAARAGHARLYEHLCASVPYWPEGEAGLTPLYQAVAHGCRAGRYQQACVEVYRDRIHRRGEFYATHKLGLYGTELAALAGFFAPPWRAPVDELADDYRAWLLNAAAFRLRALGRLVEAVEPMRAGLEMAVAQEDWKNAAIRASNLSELHLTLGELPSARDAAARAVGYADASGDAFLRMGFRTTHADALLQAGEPEAARARLAEAEALQRQAQPQYPRLYSGAGFRYCDALLCAAERAAWAVAGATGPARTAAARAQRLAEAQAVAQRAAQTLAWIKHTNWQLDIGFDHLTQARAALYRAWLLAAVEPEAAAARRDATHAAGQAVEMLRKAGQDEFIPRALLTRACVHALNGDASAARADLDAAERIARRGGMRLHLADVHLHRARLCHDPAELTAARTLIDAIGYERRRGELDDATAVLAGRAVVLPDEEDVLAAIRGENLPQPPALPSPP